MIVPLLGLYRAAAPAGDTLAVGAAAPAPARLPLAIDAPVVATDGATAVTGWTRDLCPSGVGLELQTPLAPGAEIRASFELPALSGPARSVDLALVAQTCRPLAFGTSWAIGTRIAGTDDDTARRIIEYCYVVCQVERLRTGRQLALPTPALVEAPARVLVPASRAVAA